MIEETAETLVATPTQLQLWSANGSLLAASRDAFPRPTCLTLLRTPEWMVETLPMVASGHLDGTVRFWTIREPQQAPTLPELPRALSRLPVRAFGLPAWELSELRPLRLERAVSSAEGAAAVAVTSVGVGEGYEKLLWTADASGGVRSWRVPGAEAAGVDGSTKPPPPPPPDDSPSRPRLVSVSMSEASEKVTMMQF